MFLPLILLPKGTEDVWVDVASRRATKWGVGKVLGEMTGITANRLSGLAVWIHHETTDLRPWLLHDVHSALWNRRMSRTQMGSIAGRFRIRWTDYFFGAFFPTLFFLRLLGFSGNTLARSA